MASEDRKEVTAEDLEKVQTAREPEKLTEDEADKVIEEIIDFEGRRPVPLPGGETLYVRNPHQGEEEAAEAVYAMTLFKLHKQDGLPYIAQVARDILTMVDDPGTFGLRERRVLNEKEILDTVEANKALNDAWEEEKKTNPKAAKPEDLEAPEPIVDEGCDSLKTILSDTDIGPFEKTQALMKCISGTEFANLVIHCAEYRAGRARVRRILQAIVETGEQISDRKMKYTRYWADKSEFEAADPQIVGYVEMAYNAYQAEVLSQDFLQRLLSAVGGGDSKSSSENG
jgi:hypothetical protein